MVSRTGSEFWSVRTRILASILLVASLGLVVAGSLTYLLQRDRILGQVDDRLTSRIDAARFVVTEGTETGAFSSVRHALEAVISRVIPDRNESSLAIIDGRPAFVPGVVAFPLQDDVAFVSRVIDEVEDGSVRLGTATTAFGSLRYIATPVTFDGETGIYVTAVQLDGELSGLTGAFTTYALVALLALVAIGLVGWLVAGRLLDPIRRLRAAASRITASDRGERIPVVGRDDVSDLTRTVNDMLDRLDAAMTSQHQLLDDVRHELKTPITIVRGHLELLDPSRVDEVQATRALAIDELDRMAGLVDDIEALAETQTAVLALRETDVAALTSEVFAKVRGLRSHEWRLGGVADVTVPLDPARVTQAWLQLVDNAAKFSPAGSAITLGSTVREHVVEFWVRDSGPGIPPGLEDRIFERFGRIESGRGVSGSGLGLAIVRAIAVAHGGSAGVSSSETGSTFALVLPRQAGASLPGEEGG
jgi:signal transduction histidine kinase